MEICESLSAREFIHCAKYCKLIVDYSENSARNIANMDPIEPAETDDAQGINRLGRTVS